MVSAEGIDTVNNVERSGPDESGKANLRDRWCGGMGKQDVAQKKVTQRPVW